MIYSFNCVWRTINVIFGRAYKMIEFGIIAKKHLKERV